MAAAEISQLILAMAVTLNSITSQEERTDSMGMGQVQE